MKLADHLLAENKTPEQFAAEINVHPWSVRRYLKGERTPRRKIMRRITEKTNGEVTANDFHDPLERRHGRVPGVECSEFTGSV